MKNKLQITGILLLLISSLLVNGCKKEGPPGPAGNANVTSRTFYVSSWSWDSPNYYADFNVPELTADNINSAAVLVYFRTTSGTWYAVPYTQYTSSSDYHMGFITVAGTVEVTWFYDNPLSSGSDPNAFYGTTVYYKVVVIPPAERKANPNLDLNNYEAVKAAFHLKD